MDPKHGPAIHDLAERLESVENILIDNKLMKPRRKPKPAPEENPDPSPAPATS